MERGEKTEAQGTPRVKQRRQHVEREGSILSDAAGDELNKPPPLEPPEGTPVPVRSAGTAAQRSVLGGPGAGPAATDGDRVAGYIRLSVFAFPPECQEAARTALVQQFSDMRRAALVQLAARQGQTIGAWYEDLDRSGRALLRESREGFASLTLAARSGELRGIVAWDLSRLFRDLVGQELWLAEMEGLGVSVLVQDLPFAIDPPTRRLLRQEMGMINEYQAARMGALFSAALNQRVEQGRWVGRTYSQWGLRYDAGVKGFVRDEATAPWIRRVYETFNALGGSASKTARTLNRELEAGQAGALRPPRSERWDVTKILLHVRDPLYRRQTSYNGAEYAVPHLIPEVVPAEVVAETDRLLASRRGIYEECAARHDAPPEPYLYARMLRCAECGSAMTAYPRQGILGPSPGLRVLWICGDALRGGSCGARFYLPQPRLTGLLDRGLRQAFAAARRRMEARPLGAEEEAAARESRRRQKKRHQEDIRECGRQSERCLESYAAGLSTDRAALERRLTALSARQSAARGALESLRAAKAAGPVEERWLEAGAGRLGARFEAVWPRDWWLARDPDKAEFLKDLGLTVSVRVHPMQKNAAQKVSEQKVSEQRDLLGETHAPIGAAAPRVRGRGPFVPRQRCGLCEIDVICPALGLDGTKPLKVWETEQELEDYNLLRRSQPAQAREA